LLVPPFYLGEALCEDGSLWRRRIFLLLFEIMIMLIMKKLKSKFLYT